MAAQDLILCVDIGGNSIKVGEFSFPPEGGVLLQRFAHREYGNGIDEDSSVSLEEALRDVMLSNNFLAKRVYISLSGQNAFIRFVKVPAMTTDKHKIKEIIEFEAKQTIPFPLDEVVWDYQQIESPDADLTEIEAMFVIIKNEEVSKVTDIMEEIGMSIALIEVAPTACYNTARANMIGEEQCEMILNIGGHCSTLVFVDGGKFFVRTIPIAGDSITQQISKEFGIPFAEAEEMKRRHGFVALGGAYEEPESEVAATVSKIVRNVMTRLHGEINRSINVYRAQQKGRRPEKLHLAGGSSVMAFTPRFFSEKLRIPVEYFNPFQIVTLAPNIDKDNLAEVAHLFAEPIGLALRHLGACPVEISLIPESLRKQNAMKLKMPYFYASAATLLLCLGITYWSFSKQFTTAQSKLQKVEDFVRSKESLSKQVKAAHVDLENLQSAYDKAKNRLAKRKDWVALFNELQNVLPDNMWFTKITVQEKSGVTEEKTAAVMPEEETGFASLFGGAARAPRFTGGREATLAEKTSNAPLEWVVLEGNYIIDKGRSFEDNTFEILNINLGLSEFFNKDEIKIEALGSGSDFNVVSFKIAAKLTNALNAEMNNN